VKRLMTSLLGLAALAAPVLAATDYELREDMDRTFKGNKTQPALVVDALTVNTSAALPGSGITGNVPKAALTNAFTGLSGTLITNTCISATGKTNTYVFAPMGGAYVLYSIATSP
jgi:hypothetical protein